MDEGQQEVNRIMRDLANINYELILAILVLAFVINYLIQKIIPWLAEQLPDSFRLYLLPLVPILRLFIVFTSAVLIVPRVIEITPGNILAILGAMALALGFAFKDWISSIIAGIVALYEQPYRAGDWVEIDGDYGEVKQVGMRALKLVTPDDTTVTIPHSKIWNSNIANANDGHREHLVVTDFYVHPCHDAKRVRQILWDVGMTSPYTQLEKPVEVIVREKPWGTHYQLWAYPIDGRDEFLFLSDLTVRGKTALAEMGVDQVALPILPEMDRSEGP